MLISDSLLFHDHYFAYHIDILVADRNHVYTGWDWSQINGFQIGAINGDILLFPLQWAHIVVNLYAYLYRLAWNCLDIELSKVWIRIYFKALAKFIIGDRGNRSYVDGVRWSWTTACTTRASA